jgi:UDP-N-acetyl-D-galactosamine dehydrogenase
MGAEKIAVVGLGYVGLPLAVALARKFDVVGFDIDPHRVDELRSGTDRTNEVSAEELGSTTLRFTSDPSDLEGRSIYIVTVPTPIDDANRPDFTAMNAACDIVGPALSRGSIVVFESTVYPGVTEEICAPALERASGLRAGKDFKLGYSPERINPGDKDRPLSKITKIVSGQDSETLDRLAAVYGAVIDAGIHRASSIKVAEAAKVIENTQRDLNIALMNEISKICDLVGIRTSEVLDAAGTKWNFLRFYPGLVGGHCIGVDPYYLTAKAEQLGYHPQVILSGRRINDGMGAYIAQRVVKLLAQRDKPIHNARVGVLGITFKENVPDIRNSKVADVCSELREFGIEPLVHDPLADPAEVSRAYGIELSGLDEFWEMAALVVAVAHDEFEALDGARLSEMLADDGVLVDVRSRIDPSSLRSGITYWSL